MQSWNGIKTFISHTHYVSLCSKCAADMKGSVKALGVATQLLQQKLETAFNSTGFNRLCSGNATFDDSSE